MNSLDAFAMGAANRDKESMVFDWIKAATIIKEQNIQNASAGLHADWEWTGADILRDGKPIPKEEPYTYLASTWAVPELNIGDNVIDCYKMQSEAPDWGPFTYWPEEALAILNS